MHSRWEAKIVQRQVRDYFATGVAVEPGDMVIDVGANVGLFALEVLERTGSDLELHAIEPLPGNFALLEQNLADEDGERVRCHQIALGEAESEVEFTYFPRVSVWSTRYPGRELDQLEGARQASGPRRRRSRAATERLNESMNRMVLSGETVRCQVKRLSDLLEAEHISSVDLLKIDVEKAELDVLAGIDDRDWDRIRQVVIEVHHIDDRVAMVESQLVARGYATTKHHTDEEPNVSLLAGRRLT